MLKIGILGQSNVSNILLKIYKTCSVSVNSDSFFENIMNQRIFISKEFNLCFLVADILKEKTLLEKFTANDIVLLNSDDKENFDILKNNSIRVITYGLNAKACVTASSICEEDNKTIQFCIQRSLPTFSGKILEEQEFPITVKAQNDVNTILAAITVALINDFNINNIKSSVL